MEAARKVRTIPATVNKFTSAPLGQSSKRRTAGYARVSTDQEDQMTSYEAQLDYYTKFIKDREDWAYVDVYTDEGISATSTAKREGFNKMVADALAGKLDLIVTKSVSRFARNTVDSLSTIRKLKEKGVEVFFEKENIWTFDGKGELLITIMSSLAQEESRSISENCTWGQRKRLSDGKVTVPYKRFLGYDKGDVDGVLKLNEGEAVIIRKIYRLFLGGCTPHKIAKTLTSEGIPTPGKKAVWHQGTVQNILTNEKYKGDALLQKSYTVDFLTKRKKINEGEVPQYYVENAHEAIIEPAVFEMVQHEIRRRKTGANRHSGVGMFASRVKCGGCGSWYGSKVWHSNSKYRRVVYRCNSKFRNDRKCETPHLTEGDIKTMFVSAANKLLADKKEVVSNFRVMKKQLFSTEALEAERQRLHDEMTFATEAMQKCIEENAKVALDQAGYNMRYQQHTARYEAAKERHAEVSATIADKKGRGELVEAFIRELGKHEGLLEDFDEGLWFALVEHATVFCEGDVRFTFKDGTEIQA